MYIWVFGTNSAVWNLGVWYWNIPPDHRILWMKTVLRNPQSILSAQGREDTTPGSLRAARVRFGACKGHIGLIPRTEGAWE